MSLSQSVNALSLVGILRLGAQAAVAAPVEHHQQANAFLVFDGKQLVLIDSGSSAGSAQQWAYGG